MANRKRFEEMLPPVLITTKQKQSIYALAKIRNKTMSEIVRELIDDYLGNLSTEDIITLEAELESVPT